jgi:caa(3)-type oxidase subunit IV
MADHKNWKRLGKGDLPTEDADVGLGHIVPIKVYNMVFAALLVLTVLTVWAASLQVSATAHLVVATLIASVKGTIVALVFMHLWFEKKLLWVVAFYPLLILGLMILGTTGDASVKKRGLPSHAEITYEKGRAFGVKDRFIPDSEGSQAE